MGNLSLEQSSELSTFMRAYRTLAFAMVVSGMVFTPVAKAQGVRMKWMDNAYIRVKVPADCTGATKHEQMPTHHLQDMFKSEANLNCGTYDVMLISGGWTVAWPAGYAEEFLKRQIARSMGLGNARPTDIVTKFFPVSAVTLTDGTQLNLPSMLVAGVFKKGKLIEMNLTIVEYNIADPDAGFCMHAVATLFRPSLLSVAQAITNSVVLDNDRVCRFGASENP